MATGVCLGSPLGEAKIPHLTRKQRVARGKAARKAVPREHHAEFSPAHRPDPISLLEEQALTRVPELVPIRYGRMSVSPFTFYRGAALIMASDLATAPNTGIRAQLCGDAHLSNFGMFGSPERNLVFDVNDFDETAPGPWEWDVKRLAASFEVSARDMELDDASRRTAVLGAVRAYREAMEEFASKRNLDVWYAYINADNLVPELRAQATVPERANRLDRSLANVRTRESMHVLTKLTEDSGGEPRIVSQPPLVVPMVELVGKDGAASFFEVIRTELRRYGRTLETDRRHLLEQFRLVDLARKVVGVGSVGTRCWIALMLGNDGNDPLFLQLKEAQESVLERFVGKSVYRNHGQRVVAGQRLMQATSDIFLGWDRVEGTDGHLRDFYCRQLNDWKGSVEIEQLRPQGLTNYARVCGWTLARAHARSGDRVAIASYLGKSDRFDQAIADFSVAYADQNERDYDALKAAIKSGRITAEVGV